MALRPRLDPLSGLFPFRPLRDRRPLFLAVLYELGPGAPPVEQAEMAVEGTFDPETFSFASTDSRWILAQGTAEEWRTKLPAELQVFFGGHTPAFAIRAATSSFQLELFLRPVKNPVAYGEEGSPALPGDGVTINYVQRPRLEVIGTICRKGGNVTVVAGDATQDRHWMTSTRFDVRWLWLLARFDDGRECMAYEMRTGNGGRKAPADAGRPIGGGAWIVERDGRVSCPKRWSLVPSHHEPTRRGLVPSRFTLTLPDEGVRLTLEHEQRTFVPTRALSELNEAGIWESPARAIESEGIGPGRYWVDFMAPMGST